MLPSAVNDTMRDMMSQIRDVGDGIRGGTYTMTAPVITGGSITGVALSGNTLTSPVITGGSINNTTVGATTRSTGAFTTLASNGATTFTAGTASTSTTTGTAVITGGLGVSGRINAANFDGIVGANTAAAGNFTTLGATGVATFSAGTVSAPAITTTGDTNTGIFFPAADTIAFTEGGAESMRITSAGNVGIGTTAPTAKLHVTNTGSGDSLLIEDSTNPDNTPFVIDSSGVVITGYTQSQAIAGATYQYQMNAANPFAAIRWNNSNSSGLTALFGRSRSATVGTNSIVVANDSLGNLAWVGDDGATFIQAASISAAVDGTPGTNDMPGRLVFSTTADGSSSPTERMRIDSAGNVGIGTSSPAQKLQVVGVILNYSAAAGQTLIDMGQSRAGDYAQVRAFSSPLATAGYTIFGLNAFSNLTGTNTQVGAAEWVKEGSATDNKSYYQIFTHSGSALGERMRIDSSGNVGIGTSSPADKLEVDGIIRSSTLRTGATNRTLELYSGTAFNTGGAAMAIRGSATGFNDNGMEFYTAGTERMRIDSSGNVLVNTTSTTGTACMHIPATASKYSISFRGSATTSNACAFYNSGGSGVGEILIGASSTTYATSSDYRLKENIAPMTGALATVQALKPVTYKWKLDGSDGQGFIAHELQEVVPDAVVGEKDAVETVDDVDADGKVIGTKEVPKYQGIDTSFLVATLTAAIQELKAEFDAYKATHP
jgi:hypothetical protein